MTVVAPETAYILDGHALIFQNFHAVAGMTAPDGRAVNAVFGFTRDLVRLHQEIQPTYLVAAFDLPGPVQRSTVFPAYKANRSEPPDDLTAQIPLILRVVQGMNIPILTQAGYEADDVMATLAVAGAAKGIDVYLCTGDKDCRQLVNDRVKMYNLRKNAVLDRAAIIDEWGVTPEQVVDYQALVGDSVDNIPGVPGVGPKTAAKLLQEHGSLDKLIARAAEIKGKLGENLRAAIAGGSLAVSRSLVKLETTLPITIDWPAWRRRDWDYSTLADLFTELGFRRFAQMARDGLKRIGAAKNASVLAVAGLAPNAAAATAAGPSESDAPEPLDFADDGLDFAFGANAVEAPIEWEGRYTLVDTAERFTAFLAQVRSWSRFAFDLETTGLDPWTCRIVGIAFCPAAGEAYYLPVRGPLGATVLDETEVLTALRPIFADPAIGKVNQNIKFDVLVLHAAGVPVHGIVGDSMLAHYLLEAGARSHNLDDLSREYLKHETTPITELLGKGKNQRSMDQVPIDAVCAYACEDADVAFRLCECLADELTRTGLRNLYDEVEVPLIAVLARMEATGVRLDVPFLKKLGSMMNRQIDELEKEIHALAGKPFNIGSPKQLREILFDEMKLPIQGKTKLTGEASTDQESLENLAALGHKLPQKIIEYRAVAKLKGTYVDALPALVNPKTGRLHTSFNQTITATGRLSSSNPNLQNIPARTEQGKQIRQAFIPSDGNCILTADYSQIELRLLAHFCEDEQLRTAFADDGDIHTRVAAEIFRVPETAVTSDQRRVAKTVNFGVIYGMSAHGLAARLGMPLAEAEGFINAYFARYPKVLAYQDRLLRECRRVGYVSTILGRRRRFDKSAIRPKSTYQQRNQGEREAINMEIQGSAADLMKLALLKTAHGLQEKKLTAQMLLTVHDELVFEVPPSEVPTLRELVTTTMTTAMKLTVPLRVDIAVGPNWLDVAEQAA